MREGRSVFMRSCVGVFLVVTLVTGCGGTPPSPSTSAASTQATATGSARAETSAAASAPAATSPDGAGLEAELVTAGRLTFCTNLRPGRMGFRDENGEPAGVNIEIATEIAKRLGLEPEIRESAFEALLDAVAGRQCDVSISSQHITQTRLQRIEMVPYLQGIQHVVVRAGNPAGIVELTDLCGKILAVQTGSTHVDLVLGQGDHSGAGIDRDCATAGKPKVDLREFADDGEAAESLADGKADAYIGSDFVAADRPADFELATALPPIRNGIGLPKDHPALFAAVDGALQSMIGDGRYLEILEEFGVAGLSIAN